MSKQIVSTASAPAAVGPYSQAIVSNGLVFCSGQIPLDPESGELVVGTVADQTRRCMENLAAILEGAGSSLANAVKVTAFLVDMGDFAEFNDAYGEFFGDEPPARATFAVAALPRGAEVEIECIAHL
ncbi:MAG: RidA family protein [Actinomycetota bacterium]